MEQRQVPPSVASLPSGCAFSSFFLSMAAFSSFTHLGLVRFSPDIFGGLHATALEQFSNAVCSYLCSKVSSSLRPLRLVVVLSCCSPSCVLLHANSPACRLAHLARPSFLAWFKVRCCAQFSNVVAQPAPSIKLSLTDMHLLLWNLEYIIREDDPDGHRPSSLCGTGVPPQDSTAHGITSTLAGAKDIC